MSHQTPELSVEATAAVAHLARLAVTEEDLAQYSSQLSAILAYVDQLQSVNTANVAPFSQPEASLSSLAEDDLTSQPTDQVAVADFLASAPASEPPYLKVKAVLK